MADRHLAVIAENTEKVATLLASLVPPSGLGPLTLVILDAKEDDGYLRWSTEIQIPGKPPQTYSGNMKKDTPVERGLFAAIHCTAETLMTIPHQDRENVILVTSNWDIANWVLPNRYNHPRDTEHAEQANELRDELTRVTKNWCVFHREQP